MTGPEQHVLATAWADEIQRRFPNPADWLLRVRAGVEALGLRPASCVPLGGVVLASVLAEVIRHANLHGISEEKIREALRPVKPGAVLVCRGATHEKSAPEPPRQTRARRACLREETEDVESTPHRAEHFPPAERGVTKPHLEAGIYIEAVAALKRQAEDEIRILRGQLDRSRQDREDVRLRLETARAELAAAHPPLEPEPTMGRGRASARELRTWLDGAPIPARTEDFVGARLEAAGLVDPDDWRPTPLGLDLLAQLRLTAEKPGQ